MKSSGTEKSILLTFDVEDWFQVENFKDCILFSSWPSMELRVEVNTYKILDLLDSFDFKPKGTFFILGWIARKIPWLVKEIHKRGHEIASHGIEHHLCTRQTPDELFQDLEASRMLLEDLAGTPVFGYRAPSFAINHTILKLVHRAGYRYDSSYNSFSMHDRYGTLDLSQAIKTGSAYKFSEDFFELPVSNLFIGSKVLPLGGGGYFRLIPYPLFNQGIKKVFEQEDAFIFYSHPWEFDPEQPRVKQAPLGFKLRHYVNLKQTENKMRQLIKNFRDQSFQTCFQYLNVSRMEL